MGRFKLLVVAASRAAVLGTAVAPSASAAPYDGCGKIHQQFRIYQNVLYLLVSAGYSGTQAAHDVNVKVDTYEDAYLRCVDAR